MATEYAFTDDSGLTRFEGHIVPDPGGSDFTTPVKVAVAGAVAPSGYALQITAPDEPNALIRGGIASGGTALFRIESDEDKAATLTVADGGTKDGLAVLSTSGGLFIEARTGANDADTYLAILDKSGNDTLTVTADGHLGFFDHATVAQPVVPLTTPSVQNVIDALVSLGLIVQHD